MKLSRFGNVSVVAAMVVALNLLILPSSMAGTVAVGVSAIISSSITETVTTALDFGTIDLDPAGDTVQIDASGGATVAATITNSSLVTGETSGLITITSGVVASVAIVYPAADVTLTSGGDSLTIVAATIAASSSATGVATDGINPFYIYVGGTIVIPAAQPTGTYTGSMSITINYS